MSSGPPPPAERTTLVLLSQPGCHLCHEMRANALPVLEALGLALEERDVRDDAALERLYLLEIPVLLCGAIEVARHRITPEALRRRLSELGLGPR